MPISPTTSTTRSDGSRLWVYPRQMKGSFHRWHWWTSAFLHLFLVVVPWIEIGGYRALLIDLPGRKVWVLGYLFTASDGALLMLMGLFATFALFFFTSLFGRLWCGYMCPHSVFLLNWVLPLENWIEGDRKARIRRDNKGVQWQTTARKAVKFALFGLISFLLSMAFMGFFSDPWLLWSFQEGNASYGIVAAFTGMWFFDFALFREQFCNFLCPYARLQGAMMDDQSLEMTYDTARGDPRGGGKAAIAENRCVDCDWCVHVCPQGIDIRDGFQLECIACGRCADACAAIHEKVGGTTLVQYGTQAGASGGETRLFRVRTVLYAGLLCVIGLAFVGILATRTPFEATVNRSPGTLFQVDGDQVRNTYIVRITNTGSESASYSVTVDGLDGALVSTAPVTLAPEESRTVPMVVQVFHSNNLVRTHYITVTIDDGEGRVVRKATFKTPAGKLEGKSS